MPGRSPDPGQDGRLRLANQTASQSVMAGNKDLLVVKTQSWCGHGSTSFGNKAVFIHCGMKINGQGGAILFGFQHAAKCERRCDIPQFTFTVHTDLPRPPIRNLSSGFLQSESGPNSGGKQDCDPDLPVELANAPVNQADGIEEALVAELCGCGDSASTTVTFPVLSDRICSMYCGNCSGFSEISLILLRSPLRS